MGNKTCICNWTKQRGLPSTIISLWQGVIGVGNKSWKGLHQTGTAVNPRGEGRCLVGFQSLWMAVLHIAPGCDTCGLSPHRLTLNEQHFFDALLSDMGSHDVGGSSCVFRGVGFRFRFRFRFKFKFKFKFKAIALLKREAQAQNLCPQMIYFVFFASLNLFLT